MDLHGRAAFVTGGSGDLGAAACEALARAGCDVAVGYVGNRDGAAKTVRLVATARRKASKRATGRTAGSALASADVRPWPANGTSVDVSGT